MWALMLFSLAIATDISAQEWNAKTTFSDWKRVVNAKVEYTPEAMVLTDLKMDSQIISGPLAIDASKFNTFKLTYRATGTGIGGGQIFYAHTPGRFTERNMWRIPRLNGDGNWHTITLELKDIVNPKSWTEGGTVVQLRLDPTDSAGGKIEIASFGFFNVDPGKPEWSAKNGFHGWRAQANTKVAVTAEALVMTDIKADPQVISDKLNIDPTKYNAFKFTYRATGTGTAGGELYYAHKHYAFSSKKYWRIPKLISDGQWHTVILKADALRDAQSWTNGGNIVHLRFDPTNSAGGKIEISEMAFFFE